MKSYQQLLNENAAWAKEIFEKLDKKLTATALRDREKIPTVADRNGMHNDVSVKNPNDWTAGFYAGMNYMLYNHTKNEEYFKTARRIEEKMDVALRNYDRLDHDVGFLWHLTAGASYRLTGDKNSRTREMFAASTLASRFVLGGDYIRAWSWGDKKTENWTIIDCMMNLPLLYFASEEIKDDRFKRIAMAHADNAMRTHIRPDGSVVHIVEHDRDTGDVVATYGGQGIAEGSSWSRGQAWALYGFVISYLHTGEEKYLDTAKRVAHYFIANCCDDWLPRVDFRAPAEPVYYDTTAGACAACGLLELARILPEGEGGMYMHAALNLLHAMTDRFTDFDPANDCVLRCGTVRYPAGMTEEQAGVHTNLVYADFFYTEAILKLLGETFFIW